RNEKCLVYYNNIISEMTYFKGIAISSAKNSDFFYTFLNKTKSYNFDIIKYSYFLIVHKTMLGKEASKNFIEERTNEFKNSSKKLKKERKDKIKSIKENNRWKKN